MHQSTNPWINQSTIPWINQSINQPIHQSVNPAIQQPSNQSVNHARHPDIQASRHPDFQTFRYPATHPSIRSSIRPAIRPPVRPSVCPLIHPSIHLTGESHRPSERENIRLRWGGGEFLIFRRIQNELIAWNLKQMEYSAASVSIYVGIHFSIPYVCLNEQWAFLQEDGITGHKYEFCQELHNNVPVPIYLQGWRYLLGLALL